MLLFSVFNQDLWLSFTNIRITILEHLVQKLLILQNLTVQSELCLCSSEQSSEEEERKHERKSKQRKSDSESESDEEEESESESSQSESEDSESEAEVKKKKKVLIVNQHEFKSLHGLMFLPLKISEEDLKNQRLSF